MDHAVDVLITAGMSTPHLRSASLRAGQLTGLGRWAKISCLAPFAFCIRPAYTIVYTDAEHGPPATSVVLCLLWMLLLATRSRDHQTFASVSAVYAGLVLMAFWFVDLLSPRIFNEAENAFDISVVTILILLTIGGPAGTARVPWIGPSVVKLLVGLRRRTVPNESMQQESLQPAALNAIQMGETSRLHN